METKILTVAISKDRLTLSETVAGLKDEETICKALVWRWRNLYGKREAALFFYIEGSHSPYISRGKRFEEMQLGHFEEAFNKVIVESAYDYRKIRFALYSRLNNKENAQQSMVCCN